MFNTVADTVALKGDTLINVTTITMAAIDNAIGESIAAIGEERTMQEYAKSAARGSDSLFRCALAIGNNAGVFNLPAKINAKGEAVFPNDTESVKRILGMVSADSRNSQRKQVSKALNYGWRVATAGHDVFAFPSIVSMELALKPAKSIDVAVEESAISASGAENAETAAAAEAAAAEAAAAEAAAAEAAAAEAAAAEAAAEAKAKAEAEAKAKAMTDNLQLQKDVRLALYGTDDDRAELRARYAA